MVTGRTDVAGDDMATDLGSLEPLDDSGLSSTPGGCRCGSLTGHGSLLTYAWLGDG